MVCASRLLFLSLLLFSEVAEAKCPDRFDGADAVWGAPTAINYDHRLYEPKGLKMLGRNISYVIIEEKESGWDMYFRLAGEFRSPEQPLSKSLRDVFARSYKEVGCDEMESICEVYFDVFVDSGSLIYVAIEDSEAPAYRWKGLRAPLVQQDASMAAGTPVYLNCEYIN
jgi:hypothetical protein